MFIRKYKTTFALCVAMILSACATQVPPPSATQLSAKNWQMDGLFGYHDKAQAFNASYMWQNQGDQYHIHVIGPLGAYSAELSGDSRQARIETSDGKSYQAANAAQLMQQNLGWSIPVQDLMHWLWATPNPNLSGNVSKNAQGQVVQIQQAGWVINYSNYAEYQNQQVPNRIVLTQPDKKITVVIQHRN